MSYGLIGYQADVPLINAFPSPAGIVTPSTVIDDDFPFSTYRIIPGRAVKNEKLLLPASLGISLTGLVSVAIVVLASLCTTCPSNSICLDVILVFCPVGLVVINSSPIPYIFPIC